MWMFSTPESDVDECFSVFVQGVKFAYTNLVLELVSGREPITHVTPAHRPHGNKLGPNSPTFLFSFVPMFFFQSVYQVLAFPPCI